MHRRMGFVLMGLGVLLIGAALLLLGYNRLEDARAGREAQAALDELRQQIEAQSLADAQAREQADAADADATENDGESEAAAETESQTMLERLAGQSAEYIGYLTIPALGLELPVRSDWSYPKLRTAPCRYSGSAETDNLVVVGHNYSRHFGNLHRLTAGSQILFTDLSGQSTEYSVTEVLNLEPTSVDEVVNSKYALTLLTCTPGGQMRVAVRCTRESAAGVSISQ